MTSHRRERMSDLYKLEGRTPVPVSDNMAWANWRKSANRVVAKDYPLPGVVVSTVFLGIDHQFDDGPPLLFETLVSGGKLEDDMECFSTMWREAEKQHRYMVEKVLAAREDQTDG